MLLSPLEIIAALCDRNIYHFCQAHGTPFTLDPLAEIFEYTSSSDFLQQIKTQRNKLKNLHSSTKMFLNQMLASKRESSILPMLSIDSFRRKFCQWRESTSTSPCGTHLGHWRAISIDYSEDEVSEEARILKAMQDDILEARVNLINYALKWNYSYKRWRVILTTMIFKEYGNIMMHRLRVIHLYEADLSALLGIKWRELTFEMFHNNLLDEGLYGAVPSKVCSDPVVISELQYEISRCSRRPMAEGKADAAGCYDLMIPALTSATSQVNGMPKSICIVHAKTLQEAKYHLKIMLNISEEYYQNGELTPIYGNGQGSTNSPSAWLFISNVIFKCHRKKAHGSYYADPQRLHSVHLYITGFVDDINIFNNLFLTSHVEAKDLIERLQKDTQLFSDLLWTTGGKLEPRKCNYSLMIWKFDENGAPSLDHSSHDSIVIKDNQGSVISNVQYLLPEESVKYLGHHKELSGTQTSQQNALEELVRNETAFVATCHLSPHLVFTYYTSIFLKKTTYPLSVSFFSKKKLRRIQGPFYRALLQSLGYNKNTAIPVRYGSPSLSGIGLRCLYLEQGIQCLQQFLRHWRTSTHISKLLRITVAWCQYSLGTGKPFLNDMQRDLPHFEAKWLKNIRSFLRHINAHLELDEDFVPPLQREFDAHIMDIVIDSKKFANCEIERINYCRLYLQVHTISDITKSSGVWLHQEFLQGKHTIETPTTTEIKFNQQRPGPKSWRLWRRANLLWASKYGRLHTSLGQWLIPCSEHRMLRFAYRDTTDDSVYLFDGSKFKKYNVHFNLLLNVEPNQQHNYDNIPPTVLPNDLRKLMTTTLRLDPTYTTIKQPILNNINSTTFFAYVTTLPVWEQQLLDDILWLQPPNEVLEKFLTEKIFLLRMELQKIIMLHSLG